MNKEQLFEMMEAQKAEQMMKEQEEIAQVEYVQDGALYHVSDEELLAAAEDDRIAEMAAEEAALESDEPEFVEDDRDYELERLKREFEEALKNEAKEEERLQKLIDEAVALGFELDEVTDHQFTKFSNEETLVEPEDDRPDMYEVMFTVGENMADDANFEGCEVAVFSDSESKAASLACEIKTYLMLRRYATSVLDFFRF